MLRRRFLLFLALIAALILTGVSSHSASARQDQQGKIIADLGFRPKVNGFSFPNYGKANVTNLTPDEMRELFGDQICASLQDNKCILVPQAEKFMAILNDAMNGGHCEGFASLSLLIYGKQIDPSTFGGSSITDLKLDGNEKLQRELARWFTTQITSPTTTGKLKGRKPSELLDTLIDAYKDPTKITTTYTMAIFQPEFKNGHAITPYAVVDMGDGKYRIMVYDNNFPGEERFVEVDRNAEKWSYMAAINPSEPEAMYIGDATTFTMYLTPSTPRVEKQVCDLCAQLGSSKAFGRAAAAPQYNELWLEGEADLLITNEDGKRLGYVDGKFVNEIEDAQFNPLTSDDALNQDDPEPVYYMPVGKAFQLELNGKEVKSETPSAVSMLGPGYELSVDGVKLEPGQVDAITFAPDGKSLSYKPGGSEAPNLTLGTQTPKDDYEFSIQGIEVDQGGSVQAAMDMDKGQLAISISDSKNPAKFGLEFNRIDDKSENTFTNDEISLESGDILYIDFTQWTGQGGTLKLELDKKGDGTIDESIDLKDSK